MSQTISTDAAPEIEKHHECPCGTSWFDYWDCACNDRCPDCNKEIVPSEAIDLSTGESGL